MSSEEMYHMLILASDGQLTSLFNRLQKSDKAEALLVGYEEDPDALVEALAQDNEDRYSVSDAEERRKELEGCLL